MRQGGYALYISYSLRSPYESTNPLHGSLFSYSILPSCIHGVVYLHGAVRRSVNINVAI
jgi:hypothetical protein